MQIFLFQGPNSPSAEEVLEIFSRASEYHKQMGVELVLDGLTELQDPTTNFDISGAHGRRFRLKQAASISTRKAIPLLISGQAISGSEWVSGGLSDSCGVFSRKLTSWAAIGPSDPERGAVIVAHELGHIIGLGHVDNKDDIMHPDAQSYLHREQAFAADAINKVKNCLKRRIKKICRRKEGREKALCKKRWRSATYAAGS